MANTKSVGLRLDLALYEAYMKKKQAEGSSATRGLEEHMSEVTGLPIRRVPSGVYASNPLGKRKLDFTCEICKAEPGQKCRDMRTGGEGTIERPHPTRGSSTLQAG